MTPASGVLAEATRLCARSDDINANRPVARTIRTQWKPASEREAVDGSAEAGKAATGHSGCPQLGERS